MVNLYKTVNNIFDPAMNDYLTDKAVNIVEKAIQDMVGKKIGKKRMNSLEKCLIKNSKEDKLKEFGEKVLNLVKYAELGNIHVASGHMHPFLEMPAMSYAKFLCGLDYYLNEDNYDLDKTHDRVTGSQVIVSDSGLTDYIKGV